MVWRSCLIWSGRVVRAGSASRAKRAWAGKVFGLGVGRGQAGEAGGGQPVAGGLARGAGRLQPVQQRHQLLHLRHDPPLLGEGREGERDSLQLWFGDVLEANSAVSLFNQLQQARIDRDF